MRATTFLFFSCFFVGCGSGPAEEECQPTPWYADADGDGFGTGAPVQACDAPAGRVADNDDCDDASAEVNPDAVEVCGGIDEDCDGLIDDKDPNVQDKPTWYWDGDADGHGIATPFVIA